MSTNQICNKCYYVKDCELPYKGKGYVILNIEDLGDHGSMTTGVAKTFAPEVTMINGGLNSKVSNEIVEYYKIKIDGVDYDVKEAIKKFNIKIISTSLSGKTPEPILQMWKDLQEKYGIIMFNNAGKM